MLFMAIICVYPFIYVIFASVSTPSMLMAHSGLLYKPLGYEFAAYTAVMKHPMIAVGYKNTIMYVALGTAINLIMTILGAFVLSRKKLYIKKFMTLMVVVTMFFSGGLIPQYLLIKQIGLYDTIWALILPSAISVYNMLVLRTAFAGIPSELEEAAKIDGAGDLTVLFRIIVPLSQSAIAVMVLFYGVAQWNSWFPAAMYLRDRAKYPLQLFLREILIYSNTDSMTTTAGSSDKFAISESLKYSSIIVSTLPILAIYPFLQKYFVKGILIGGVKG